MVNCILYLTADLAVVVADQTTNGRNLRSSREDLQFWQTIEKSKAWPLRTNFVVFALKLEAEIKLRPICSFTEVEMS